MLLLCHKLPDISVDKLAGIATEIRLISNLHIKSQMSTTAKKICN